MDRPDVNETTRLQELYSRRVAARGDRGGGSCVTAIRRGPTQGVNGICPACEVSSGEGTLSQSSAFRGEIPTAEHTALVYARVKSRTRALNSGVPGLKCAVHQLAFLRRENCTGAPPDFFHAMKCARAR